MKIAYVLNTYPQPSQSFIRREIQALERRGVDVLRLPMRPSEQRLVDPGDQTESQRCHYVLAAGAARLVLAKILSLLLSVELLLVTHKVVPFDQRPRALVLPALFSVSRLTSLSVSRALLAAITRAAEAGGIPGLTDRNALFDLLPDGTRDQIHLSPLGAYIVALTHYAVLYHRSPEGLPHQVTLSDGTAYTALDAEGAGILQGLVWQVVTALPRTGLASAAVEVT